MKKVLDEIECPEGLSGPSKELWAQLADKQARSPERRAMFTQALRSLDRSEECRAAIDREGLTVGNAGGMKHMNPLLKVEKDARAQFALLWKALKLNYNHGLDFNRIGA